MAKLKPEPIQLADLTEYLEGASDFSFEMSILCTIRDLGIRCEHSGHYEDPVTKKSREFDIRAIRDDGITKVRYAIECKNIRDNFPILVSCMRRTAAEAHLDVAALIGKSSNAISRKKYSKTNISAHSIHNPDMYMRNAWVGKNVAQIGRFTDPLNSITANDSELYEKWGQALASANDLVSRISDDEELTDQGNIGFGFVFPILVVPDDRLWAVFYEENGRISKAPHKVNRITCYIGKEYRIGPSSDAVMQLSHLEILTQSGLIEFIENDTDSERLLPALHAKNIETLLRG